jgi:hypothetical protein
VACAKTCAGADCPAALLQVEKQVRGLVDQVLQEQGLRQGYSFVAEEEASG